MQLVLSIVLLAAGLALVPAAWIVRAPFVAELRPWLWLGVTVGAGLVAWLSQQDRRRFASVAANAKHLATATLALALLALSLAIGIEARFQYQRWRVLSATPAVLEKVGQHVMIGYRDPAEVRRLLERRAIGGVFITRRNVAGKDPQAIATEIASFQAIRRQQGMPPIWVATDQEGGAVSRLSPPLTRLPVLAELVRGLTSPAQIDAARLKAIDDYADTHGRELASVGVNLNFAPVVDLDYGLKNPDDAYSRISERAISPDPLIVAAVAERYCDGLERHGVRCTLKHFPGLGRVYEDTHISAGKLTASVTELKAHDWIPFERLGGKIGHFAMIGHVIVSAVDNEQVATLSSKVVQNHLRPIWQGPTITDDMCMGPIFWDRGIGSAGVRALRSGLDMLLVSWDGAQAYPVLSALLALASSPSQADEHGLQRSKNRLNRALPATTPRPVQ